MTNYQPVPPSAPYPSMALPYQTIQVVPPASSTEDHHEQLKHYQKNQRAKMCRRVCNIIVSTCAFIYLASHIYNIETMLQQQCV